MTEHGSGFVERSASEMAVGQSRLEWQDGRLVYHIDERSTPLGRKIRGRVVVETEGLGNTTFLIDGHGRHRWQPLAPLSRVTVELDEPSLRWSGDGYLDRNDGDEPLESAFSFWDWSRTIIDGERTAILYNTDMINGESCLSAFLVDKVGAIQEVETPPARRLPPTPIWRMGRRTRAEGGGAARIVKTLEDTPFYSRSVVETQLFGKPRHAIHESLSGSRLDMPVVQFMLPYRMPRKA